MLTISQLADLVGVTVRAVRHYHQRGLLAEPERDASGYRRYDAQAVIDLIRIKTLAEAGVPLARVEELLAAEPEEFARAVTKIDEELAERIRDLKRHRRRIAELAERAGGERLFLPAEVVAFLDRLRALGVSERTVRIERDGWIMLAARHPAAVVESVADKQAHLADPEYRRIYLAYDQAGDWDPDDPRLDELADAMLAFVKRAQRGVEELVTDENDLGTPVEAVLVSRLSEPSAGWRRLNELLEQKAKVEFP